MKKLLKRLLTKKGESLVETLAAILVVTLASVVLLSMISSAARINHEVDELSEKYNAGQQYVERGQGEGQGEAEVEIRLYYSSEPSGKQLGKTRVTIYSDSESGLYAFYAKD